MSKINKDDEQTASMKRLAEITDTQIIMAALWYLLTYIEDGYICKEKSKNLRMALGIRINK